MDFNGTIVETGFTAGELYTAFLSEKVLKCIFIVLTLL